DAAVRLRSEFKGMREFELRRIARTEINRAQQDAAELTEIELGVTFHQWITGSDERVRSSHRDQHNEIARVGEPFSNGLRRPLEAGAALSEVVNCRCRIAPWIMPEGFRAPTGKSLGSPTYLVLKAFFPDEIVEIESGEMLAGHGSNLSEEELSKAQKAWRQNSTGQMTKAERGSIRRYTQDSKINVAIREGGDISAEMAEDIANIQTALERNLTTQPMTVHRGIGRLSGYSARDAFDVDDLDDLAKLKGKVLRDPAFLSTSAFEAETTGDLVKLTINVPKGTPAAFVEEITAKATQEEIILGLNTRFVVRDVKFRRFRGPGTPTNQWNLIVDVIP
ncbi:hypothetical protein LCGC14_3034540, partial [marine sediment metagenome]